jgi:tetratricopeptide (TPR) repeat protein
LPFNPTGPGPLTQWLLRPLVDLGPCEQGPLYARGLEQYWKAFVEAQRPRFVLQRTLPWQFRTQLLKEIGLAEYQVDDPRELSEAFRNTRWNILCDAVENWTALTTDQQCRMILLLQALCFYKLISNRVPPLIERINYLEPNDAEIAFWGATARYLLDLPDRVADYGHANLSEFENIAAKAPRDDPTALNAALKILVHKAKVGEPAEELIADRARAEQLLESILSTCDLFTGKLLTSRFYRAAAFVPQRLGDRLEVVRLMDLAEHHALAMIPADIAQELIYLENLHPVIESRTKEALWLGDLDLALSRALRVIDLDPYDSRVWLELGQIRLLRKELALAAEAYAFAAVLGPPASAIARHMAGVCFRELGQPFLAAFFLNSALQIDPSAVSAHEQIQALPNLAALTVLKEWSLRSFIF